MEIHPALQHFIQTWGEMSSSWGISRTMSQIYALLFIRINPLDTDTIMESLDISRGNANMNLRALLDWGLVKKVTMPSSRKEYFTAVKDVGLLTSLILVERQKRELIPVTDALNTIVKEIEESELIPGTVLSEEELTFRENIKQLIDFLFLFNDFTSRMLPYLKEKNIRRVDKILQILES